MWPFKRKSRRRVEGRETTAEWLTRSWQKFREAGGLRAVGLAVIFYLAVLAMDLFPLEQIPYRRGQFVPQDIHARTSFQMPSPQRMEARRRHIREATRATFRLNTSLVYDQLMPVLRNLPERLRAATQPATQDQELRKRFGLADDQAVQEFWDRLKVLDTDAYAQAIQELQNRLAETYIVADEQATEQVRRSAGEVILVSDTARRVVDIQDLISLRKTERIRSEVDRLSVPFDASIRPYMKAYLLSALTGDQPMYLYDSQATQRDIATALADLEANPPAGPDGVFERFERGEIIASATRDDQDSSWSAEGLSEAEYARLQAEHLQYLRDEGRVSPLARTGRIAGRAALLLILVIMLCIYVARYRPELARELSRGAVLTTTLIVMLGISRAMLVAPGWNRHASLLPVLMMSMVAVIAYGRRFALGLSAVIAILVSLQMQATLSMLVVLTVGAVVCIYQLNEIRTRTKLIRVSAVAALSVFVVDVAWGLSMSIPWKFSLLDGLWGMGFALLAGFLVQGILPIVERVFRVVTSMTLLEWCDASKPLMKRLAMEAPGTYNHSLQLGAICEAAAESIGANGLLARVGAYYHDIGKINKPRYFVENQGSEASKHAKLSPAMSLLIIIGHVKDGLEMAREYGLPEMLHEFIATHHGTTLVQYFYKAAAEQRRNATDRAPDEVEFRYPGPKPNRKETAILMLSDASESSVRAMNEPTPGRIESQVHTMISRRLTDGQLDECSLTLREVHQIEASIIKSLCSIYHSRIAYPTPPGQKPSAAERNPKKQPEETEAENSPSPDEAPEPRILASEGGGPTPQ